MALRILLVGDSEEQAAMSGLQRKNSPFAFVDYNGNFGEGSVAAYLRQHDDFDAVATIVHSSYPHVEREIQEAYKGPVILLGASNIPSQKEGNVIRADYPILPSEFSKLVEGLMQK